MSWIAIVATITGLASLITAVTVIYRAVKTMLNQLEDKIKVVSTEVAKQVISEREQENAKINKMRFDSIDSKLDKLNEININKHKEQKALNNVISKSLVETWKEDFREIHKTLRLTGEITDSDKAYLDKIYHYYKDLGGNSDIDAKYKEICQVYQKRTQDKYDKAFERTLSEKEN